MKENHICTCGDCSDGYTDRCKFEKRNEELLELARIGEGLAYNMVLNAKRDPIYLRFKKAVEKAERDY